MSADVFNLGKSTSSSLGKALNALNLNKLGNLSQPFTKGQVLDFSKLKEFADNNFNFDGKNQKILQTGEKHCREKEQFILFPQCFQTTSTADTAKTRACLGNS